MWRKDKLMEAPPCLSGEMVLHPSEDGIARSSTPTWSPLPGGRRECNNDPPLGRPASPAEAPAEGVLPFVSAADGRSSYLPARREFLYP